MIFSESDVCDLLMQGRSLHQLAPMLVDHTVNTQHIVQQVENYTSDVFQVPMHSDTVSVQTFDQEQQSNWHMPVRYQQMDIAQHVLLLCTTEPQLQRCGQELLLYQERGLFPLLQYLTYLVDVMIENNIVWGVGRGSSVASYVLYKLRVHRVDSMYYDLSVHEFLR